MFGNINLFPNCDCFLQVELLIPQLQFLDDEGAQAELWELSRIFIDTLMEETGCQVSLNVAFGEFFNILK